MFVHVDNGVVVDVAEEPREGWLRITEIPPADTPWHKKLTIHHPSNWTVDGEEVAVTYTVADKTATEILDYMQRKGWMGVLSVDTHTIPADSTTEAKVTYTSKDPVTFIVDGEAIEKVPNDVYTATLTVAADAPGFIEVRIPGVERVVTITVTEVV